MNDCKNAHLRTASRRVPGHSGGTSLKLATSYLRINAAAQATRILRLNNSLRGEREEEQRLRVGIANPRDANLDNG